MRPAAAAIAVSFLLTACGTPQREPNVLDRAAANAVAVASARSESVSVTSSEGETWTLRSTGVHDYLRHRFAMTYESEVGGEKHVSRFVAIGGVTFFEWERGMEPTLPAGKRWVRVAADNYDGEADACDSVSGLSLESAGDMPFSLDWEELDPGKPDDDGSSGIHEMFSVGVSEYMEPSETLDQLRELGSEIALVGRESLRNEPTTHYRAQLDQREALRHELKEAGWKDESIACVVADMPTMTDHVDVWIDDDGLVRRTITTTHWGEGEGRTVDTTDFFDFGSDVTIEPPPADQVVDEADVSDAYEEVDEP